MKRKDTPAMDDPKQYVSIDAVLNYLMISAHRAQWEADQCVREEQPEQNGALWQGRAESFRKTTAWLKEYTA